jgi:hypothetical protein
VHRTLAAVVAEVPMEPTALAVMAVMVLLLLGILLKVPQTKGRK